MRLDFVSNMVFCTVVVNTIADAVVVNRLAITILPRDLALVLGGLLFHTVVVNMILNLVEGSSNGVENTKG